MKRLLFVGLAALLCLAALSDPITSRSNTWSAKQIFSGGTDIVQQKCMNINPADAETDYLFWRPPTALTVTHVRCMVVGTGSVVLTLRECNGDGAACGATEAAITCGTTTTSESGGVDDPAVAANVWMRVLRGTVTPTPTQVNLCMEYTVP